jgi:hypothetical protein
MVYLILVDCPNLVCFRCTEIGHNSRECRSGFRSKSMICIICGQYNHHVTTQCPLLLDSDTRKITTSHHHNNMLVEVDGISTICMLCKQRGHLLCKSHPLMALTTTFDKQSFDPM